jgi:hypothetical protein
MKKLIIISIILAIMLKVSAQILTPDVYAISGGSNTVGNINLTWTIGEQFTETFYNNANYLNQGFNQVDTVIITVIKTNFNIPHNIIVYPNPTKGIINVDVDAVIKRTRAIMFDLNGKEILNLQTDDRNYNFNISACQKGIYVLIIYDDQNNFIKKFKIEKL